MTQLLPSARSITWWVNHLIAGNDTKIVPATDSATVPPDGSVDVLVVFDKDLPTGKVMNVGGRLCFSLGGKLGDPLNTLYLYGELLLGVEAMVPDLVTLLVNVPEGVDPRLVASGLRLALLRADQLKTKPGKSPESIFLKNDDPDLDADQFAEAIQEGDENGRYANAARFLTNLPVNYLGVETYAEVAGMMFQGLDGVTITEPSDDDYARMGLFQAVCQASGRGPKIVTIRVDPTSGPTEEVDVCVGKGLVNDTGGLSYKPGGGGPEMRGDMGGSASILAHARFVADNRGLLKTSAVFFLAIAENAIGPKAYRVGDILTSYAGKTVEVTNTDAEGRLVLADTVSYALKNYNVCSVLIVATLTGAVDVGIGAWAFGIHVKGAWSQRSLLDRLEEISRQVGDPGQRLYEMGSFASAAMASKQADIVNTAPPGTGGGSQTAFHFLCAFVPEDFQGEVMFLDTAGKVDVKAKGGQGIRPGTMRPAATIFLMELFRQG